MRKPSKPRKNAVSASTSEASGGKKPDRRRKPAEQSAETKIELRLERDFRSHKILNDAFEYIAKQGLGDIVVTDFLAKCASAVARDGLKINAALTNAVAVSDRCYIRHPRTDQVTIWKDDDIEGHMSLADARASKIPACSKRRK